MFGTIFKKGKEFYKKLEEEREKAQEAYRAAIKAAMPGPSGSTPPGIRTSLTWHPSTPTSISGSYTSSAELISKVAEFCIYNDLWIRRTGSQLVDGIEPNDYDFVVEDTECVMKEWLERNGFHTGGSVLPESEFTSWKNGPVNVIVCNSRPFFKKYLMATELLKQLQPKTKQERIDIFDTVMGRNEDKYGVAF